MSTKSGWGLGWGAMSPRVWAILLTLAALSATGCGGAQPGASFVALAPNADAESDAVQRAYASLEAELSGDLEGAWEIAVSCLPASACAARAAALSGRYPVLSARLPDGPLPEATGVVGALWRAKIEGQRAWVAHERGALGLRERGDDFLLWERIGPISSFAYLDLGALSEEPFADGVPARIEQAAGPLHRVNAMVGRGGGVAAGGDVPGLYVLQTSFDARGEGWLALDASVGFRAWVDGREVSARTEAPALQPSVSLVPLRLDEGQHRLTVAVASTGGGGGVEAHWLDAPLLGEASEAIGDTHWVRPAPTEDVAERAVAAEVALLAGDPSAHERWCGEGETEGVQAMLCMRLATEARALTASARFDAALRHTQGADPVAEPARVLDATGVWRAMMQDERVERALEELVVAHPNYLPALEALALAYEDRGWHELALPLRQRVLAAFPEDCSTAEALVDLLDARGEWLRPERVPLEAHGCRGVALELARRHDRSGGDAQAAIERVRALFDRNPADSYVAELLYGWLVGTPEAEELIDVHRAWSTDAIAGAAWTVDRELASGVASRAWRDEFDAHAPGSAALVEALRFAGADDPLAAWRFDGLQATRDYLAEDPAYTGEIVLVLDAATSVFQPDGTRLEVVHQVAELRTRDALAAYGEVAVSPGAEILSVRTIKRDGRVLLPEAIGDRDAISLPELELGDFIELEWVESSSGALYERPTSRSERFFFRGAQGPYHRSIARYVVPTSLIDHVAIDERHLTHLGADVQRTRTEREGATIFAFEARSALPPPAEGMTPSPAEWLPSVRVAVDLDEHTAVRRYHEAFAALTGLPSRSLGYEGALEARIASLLEGARGEREEVQRLFRYVSDDVADVGGFFSIPAAWTWASGEGERLPLLYALLREAGFEPEVVFVRTYESDPTEGPIPDLGAFDLTAVRVPVAGGEVWLEPDYERYPFDYLRPEAQGRTALVVAGPSAGSRIRTPEMERERDRSAIDIAIELDEIGDARVTIDETVPVRLAANLRSYVQSAEDARLLEQELEGALAGSFPRVSELALEIDNLDDPDVPLRFRYAFRSEGLVHEDGVGRRRFDGGIFLRPLANWYGSSAVRTLPLAVLFPVDERVRIAWTVPDSWQVADAPAPIDVQTGGHEATREVRVRGGDVVVDRTLTLRLRRVPADAYDAFRSFLEQATETMEDPIVWRTSPP